MWLIQDTRRPAKDYSGQARVVFRKVESFRYRAVGRLRVRAGRRPSRELKGRKEIEKNTRKAFVGLTN